MWECSLYWTLIEEVSLELILLTIFLVGAIGDINVLNE